METTNESIRQLLEMLDHPEAYTEQEIHDIINHDEDTRETYRLMWRPSEATATAGMKLPSMLMPPGSDLRKNRIFNLPLDPKGRLPKQESSIFNLQFSIFNLKRLSHPSSVCCWCRASLLPPSTSCGTTLNKIRKLCRRKHRW